MILTSCSAHQSCRMCGLHGNDYEFKKCLYAHPPLPDSEDGASEPVGELATPFNHLSQKLDEFSDYWKYEHFICSACYIPVACDFCGQFFDGCHRPDCYPYCGTGQRAEYRNFECNHPAGCCSIKGQIDDDSDPWSMCRPCCIELLSCNSSKWCPGCGAVAWSDSGETHGWWMYTNPMERWKKNGDAKLKLYDASPNPKLLSCGCDFDEQSVCENCLPRFKLSGYVYLYIILLLEIFSTDPPPFLNNNFAICYNYLFLRDFFACEGPSCSGIVCQNCKEESSFCSSCRVD
jgi:hypothetical protein